MRYICDIFATKWVNIHMKQGKERLKIDWCWFRTGFASERIVTTWCLELLALRTGQGRPRPFLREEADSGSRVRKGLGRQRETGLTLVFVFLEEELAWRPKCELGPVEDIRGTLCWGLGASWAPGWGGWVLVLRSFLDNQQSYLVYNLASFKDQQKHFLGFLTTRVNL
jgi:hypothetical protein